MKINVVVHALSFSQQSDKPPVDLMAFTGNPLCTPIGVMSAAMGPSGFNNANPANVMHINGFGFPQHVPPMMYLTKEGNWTLNRESREVAHCSIEQHFELIKKAWGETHDLHLINANYYNRSNMHGMQLVNHHELDLVFTAHNPAQVVKFSHYPENGWLVFNNITKVWHEIYLKDKVEGVYTITRHGPQMITVHLGGSDIMFHFDEHGKCVDVVDIKLPDIDHCQMNADNEFFDLIQMSEELVVII